MFLEKEKKKKKNKQKGIYFGPERERMQDNSYLFFSSLISFSDSYVYYITTIFQHQIACSFDS